MLHARSLIARMLEAFPLACLLMSCSQGAADRKEWPSWAVVPSAEQLYLVERNDGTCQECVRLVERIRISDTTREGMVDETGAVAIDQQGRVRTGSGDAIKVYSATGRFLTRVGRGGRGPAEFQAVGTLFVDEAGQVHALDQLGFRETVLNARLEATLMRSLPTGPIYEAVPLDSVGDQLLVNAQFLGPEQVGHPLHLLVNGRVARSFGMPNDTAFVATTGHLSRQVATSPDGLLAAAHRYRYEVEIYSPTLEKLLRFERPNAWHYAPGGSPVPLQEGMQLWGFAQAVRFDSMGRLWTLSWEPRADWRDRVMTANGPGGLKLLRQRDDDQGLYVSRLEVIDLSTGALLGSTTDSTMVWGFLSPDRLYGFDYSEQGDPQLVIKQFSFHEKPQ